MDSIAITPAPEGGYLADCPRCDDGRPDEQRMRGAGETIEEAAGRVREHLQNTHELSAGEADAIPIAQ